MLNKKNFNTEQKSFISFQTKVFLTVLFITGCICIWLLNRFLDITIAIPGNIISSRYLFILSNNNSITTQSSVMSELSIDDKLKLINIQDFKFIINQNTCIEAKPFLLILVHSAPKNLKKRKVIRETWGQHIATITTLFLVGYSAKYKSELEKENTEYADLIQGNFFDTYRNITYKHVMALKWVTYHCSNAKYILKLDDDVFVHTTVLLNFLKQKLSLVGFRRLILCDAISTLKVKRSWRSKWRVSPKEYPGKEYPSYCAGWAILYSYDAVFLLYKQAQREPYFWIDDVHITGTLAKNINLTQISMHSMILSEYMMTILLKKSKIRKNFFFGPPNLMENEIRALYTAVTN